MNRSRPKHRQTQRRRVQQLSNRDEKPLHNNIIPHRRAEGEHLHRFAQQSPRQTMPTISLLHATYHRESGPIDVKETWLARAERRDLVEYIFAMDADDRATVSMTVDHLRVVSPPISGRVTSVRNWNAAASISTGDLLMVIADDLFPPSAWDSQLRDLLRDLDPKRMSFAVKVTDSPVPRDTLLRHPIVSRSFYEQHGLFSDAFDGVYSDNDITIRAFWRAIIVDGRSLGFEHRHPTLDPSVAYSSSHLRINSPLEYQKAALAFSRKWSRRKRFARIRLVPLRSNRRFSRLSIDISRWRLRTQSTAVYSGHLVRSIVRLLIRPSELRKRIVGRNRVPVNESDLS